MVQYTITTSCSLNWLITCYQLSWFDIEQNNCNDPFSHHCATLMDNDGFWLSWPAEAVAYYTVEVVKMEEDIIGDNELAMWSPSPSYFLPCSHCTPGNKERQPFHCPLCSTASWSQHLAPLLLPFVHPARLWWINGALNGHVSHVTVRLGFNQIQ